MVVWRVWEISVKGSESFTINNAAFVVFISVDYETTTFPGYLTITIVCFILIERLNCIWKMLTAVPARKIKIKFYSTPFASRKLRSWSNRIFVLFQFFWACSFISLSFPLLHFLDKIVPLLLPHYKYWFYFADWIFRYLLKLQIAATWFWTIQIALHIYFVYLFRKRGGLVLSCDVLTQQ